VQRCEIVRLVPIALSAQGRVASRMIDEWNELRDPSEEIPPTPSLMAQPTLER